MNPTPNERLLVAAMAGGDPGIKALSAGREVDFVERVPHEVGLTIRHEKWVDGVCRSERSVRHQVADPALFTAAAIRLVDETAPTTMRSLPCLIHQPEAAPTLVETLVGALASRVVLVFEDTPYNGSILRLENLADRCFVPDQTAAHRWSGQHVVTADIARIDEPEPLAVLMAGDAAADPPATPEAHRVLIVSYFGPPSTLVSVQRLSYWHEHLAPLAAEQGTNLHVEWLTATAAGRHHDRVRTVMDRSDNLTDSRRAQLAEMHSMKLPTIGVSWLDAAAAELDRWTDPFDTVIISVGPFGYVDLGLAVKERWDARVIIDFRDPYGGDARMGFTLERRTWANTHERAAIEAADAIVSVNDRCLDVIGRGIDIERRIVNNGFDDVSIDEAREGFVNERNDGLIRLAYCGTIFRHLPLDDVLDALHATRHRLLHAGRDQSLSQALAHTVVGRGLGFITDGVELNRILLGCDAGIIRVGGEATTATTKVFDYIGCDLDIIVVTDGAPRSGALHQMTDGLEGVFWVRNDPDELAEFFATYVPTQAPRPERVSFSRRAQTQNLLDLILTDRSR
ncbi:MAG: hypothetical protein P8I99_07510 [Acidimicrobiales bacterium]|nr:hypothetical protein [Acidimicrobiales bacterium]